jgi:RNA polymerase sigma-70 factor (ECF subfamily)
LGRVTAAEEAVDESFRHDWGSIVAYLIRLTGDWDLAEECAQEAFAKALRRWPQDGVPSSPVAWLKTTGRNRAIDLLRRRTTGEAKTQQLAMSMAMQAQDDPGDAGIGDDRLRLIFTCCHPALALEAQVALTLRTLVGLTTAEIARAFLVPVETMSKRLVRAKAKIRDAAIPYRVPPARELPERTGAVLAVLYALFNEGYSATAGAELVRRSLSDEAIRLGRLLVRLMPDEPEALGVLSLMILHDARRESRLDGNGDIVTLEEQDRTRWDRSAISEGSLILQAALRLRRAGPYQLQAAVAACHATALTAAETDWSEIALLYTRLYELAPTPVVALNRAVAVGMADGPEAGLALVDELEQGGALVGYHLMPATRADFLRRLGLFSAAEAAYRRALAMAPTDAERRYLARRLQEASNR